MFNKAILLSLLFLTSCIGPEIFSIAGYKITLGTVLTVPSKIEMYEKYKKEREKE
jgi:hypothetical protein